MSAVACPDCPGEPLFATRELFVAHRELVHPPSLKVLTPVGIESQEAVHGPKKES